MLTTKKPTAGTLTRSNLTLAILAATLVIGGTSSAASAHSRHYRVHHFHHVSQLLRSSFEMLTAISSNALTLSHAQPM